MRQVPGSLSAGDLGAILGTVLGAVLGVILGMNSIIVEVDDRGQIFNGSDG